MSEEPRCTWRYKLSTKANDKIKDGKKMESACGNYRLRLHEKGNLVLYKMNDGEHGDRALWCSNTEGKGTGPYHLRMQEDGNLVVYDSEDSPTWASDTHGAENGPFKVILQDDGNLVIYNAEKEAIWASNTMQAE